MTVNAGQFPPKVVEQTRRCRKQFYSIDRANKQQRIFKENDNRKTKTL